MLWVLTQGGHPANVCCLTLQAGLGVLPLKAGGREGCGESWKSRRLCKFQAITRHWPSPGDSFPALKLCSGGQARRPGRVHTAPEVGVQGTGSVKTSPARQSGSWSRGALHFSYLEFLGLLPLAAPEGAGAALPGPQACVCHGEPWTEARSILPWGWAGPGARGGADGQADCVE